jgi:metal-responsive CopG/Arc/MetJ family transcriptional regulator
MKNVTISISNDLLQVLDTICKDCDLSRHAFTKEALIEKIEKHKKERLEGEEKKTSIINI